MLPLQNPFRRDSTPYGPVIFNPEPTSYEHSETAGSKPVRPDSHRTDNDPLTKKTRIALFLLFLVQYLVLAITGIGRVVFFAAYVFPEYTTRVAELKSSNGVTYSYTRTEDDRRTAIGLTVGMTLANVMVLIPATFMLHQIRIDRAAFGKLWFFQALVLVWLAISLAFPVRFTRTWPDAVGFAGSAVGLVVTLLLIIILFVLHIIARKRRDAIYEAEENARINRF